jgi:hypothetical protein
MVTDLLKYMVHIPKDSILHVSHCETRNLTIHVQVVVFCDAVPLSLVHGYHYVEGTCSLLFSYPLKEAAIGFFEILIPDITYQRSVIVQVTIRETSELTFLF